MRIFYGTGGLTRFQYPVVTVGSYDGVHSGHRILLGRVMAAARAGGGESVVVTFSPHPRQVLARGGDVGLLNTLPEKRFLLDEAGIDNLVVLPFTPEFAAMSGPDFVKDILVGKIGMREFVVGDDHHFGSGKGGDYQLLMSLEREYGFTADRVPQYALCEGKVSSTAVRRLIGEGDMAAAARMLARGYILIADVDKAGRVTIAPDMKLLPPGCVIAADSAKLLPPGCVIADESAKLLPPPGRYPVRVAPYEDGVVFRDGVTEREDFLPGSEGARGNALRRGWMRECVLVVSQNDGMRFEHHGSTSGGECPKEGPALITFI